MHQSELVRLAYQLPASSTFLSEQISHQEPANGTFLSEQTSTSHQPTEQAAEQRIGMIAISRNARIQRIISELLAG
jgi:hypothetical protein